MECDVIESDITNPSVLLGHINKCMEIISKACFCGDQNQENETFIKELVSEARYEIISIINKLSVLQTKTPAMKPKAELEEELFAINYDIKTEEERLENVRQEWRKQQNYLADLQEQLYKNHRLLSVQSIKACNQGAALAGALYPIFSQPNVLQYFLGEKDFPLYIKIVDGTLAAFVKSHPVEMPLNDSPDYKFILALCRGIVIVSMHMPGRNYLLDREEGQKMLRQFVIVLPYIKYPKAETLKNAMLEVLNNFSQDIDGGNFLYGCDGLLVALADCINKVHSTIIYRLALSILATQTKSVYDKAFMETLTRVIQMEQLRSLEDHSDRDVKNLAKIAMRNIKRATGRADTMGSYAAAMTKSKKISVSDDYCQCKVEKETEEVARTASTVAAPTGRPSRLRMKTYKKSKLSSGSQKVYSKLRVEGGLRSNENESQCVCLGFNKAEKDALYPDTHDIEEIYPVTKQGSNGRSITGVKASKRIILSTSKSVPDLPINLKSTLELKHTASGNQDNIVCPPPEIIMPATEQNIPTADDDNCLDCFCTLPLYDEYSENDKPKKASLCKENSEAKCSKSNQKVINRSRSSSKENVNARGSGVFSTPSCTDRSTNNSRSSLQENSKRLSSVKSGNLDLPREESSKKISFSDDTRAHRSSCSGSTSAKTSKTGLSAFSKPKTSSTPSQQSIKKSKSNIEQAIAKTSSCALPGCSRTSVKGSKSALAVVPAVERKEENGPTFTIDCNTLKAAKIISVTSPPTNRSDGKHIIHKITTRIKLPELMVKKDETPEGCNCDD